MAKPRSVGAESGPLAFQRLESPMVDQSVAEEWRPAVGFENHYDVSSLARIKRTSGGKGVRAGRIISQRTGKNGYVYITLSVDGVASTRLVHRIVAESFIGPCPDGMETDHKNHRRDDNRPENLCWKTHKKNCQRRLPSPNARSLSGEDSKNSKLTNAQARLVLACAKMRICFGWQSFVARIWGVKSQTVCHIANGRSWVHCDPAS